MKKDVLLLCDNALAHKMFDVLKNLTSECKNYPLYSLDIATSDHLLFPNHKKCFKGRTFLNNSEMIAEKELHFSVQASYFFS